MKFTGHERDLLNTPTGTGDDTDYMHARQFSFLTGRFHSFDPIGGNPNVPQTWNRFAYALGNPLKYSDPFGLNVSSCDVNLGPCPSWNPPYWEEETITVTGSASPFGPGGSGYAPWLWMLFSGGPRAGNGGGEGGGAGGSSPARQEADLRCSQVQPDGRTVTQNVREFSQRMGMERAGGGSGGDTLLRWFASVAPRGPQDYKHWPGGSEKMGNFNYGATGSLFFSQNVLDRAAGLVQWLTRPDLSDGGWFLGSAPYGDQLGDQAMVNAGIGAGCY